MLQSLYSLAATGSFCWFLASSLWIYPHSLSYFNESIGGPLNGPECLLGSNLDWGQDLRYVLNWITINDSLRIHFPLHLAYCGSFDPAYIDPFKNTLPIACIWNQNIEDSEWKIEFDAVSVVLLHGVLDESHDGNNGKKNSSQEIQDLFQEAEPEVHAGYSIIIFKRFGFSCP